MTTTTIVLQYNTESNKKGNNGISENNHLSYKRSNASMWPLWISQTFKDKRLGENQIEEISTYRKRNHLHPAYSGCNENGAEYFTYHQGDNIPTWSARTKCKSHSSSNGTQCNY